MGSRKRQRLFDAALAMTTSLRQCVDCRARPLWSPLPGCHRWRPVGPDLSQYRPPEVTAESDRGRPSVRVCVFRLQDNLRQTDMMVYRGDIAKWSWADWNLPVSATLDFLERRLRLFHRLISGEWASLFDREWPFVSLLAAPIVFWRCI